VQMRVAVLRLGGSCRGNDVTHARHAVDWVPDNQPGRLPINLPSGRRQIRDAQLDRRSVPARACLASGSSGRHTETFPRSAGTLTIRRSRSPTDRLKCSRRGMHSASAGRLRTEIANLRRLGASATIQTSGLCAGAAASGSVGSCARDRSTPFAGIFWGRAAQQEFLFSRSCGARSEQADRHD
jgi:hypothetical protein